MKQSRLKALAVLFSLSCSLAFPVPGQELKKNPPQDTFSEAHRFVFYAVLEGCFESGLTQEEIDLIIPVRPDKEDRRSITANLVYTCPLCSPAFDAFRLYSDRRLFISQMSKSACYNTFGQGLGEDVKAQLAQAGAPCRAAIQQLIGSWIEARMTRLRLTEEEASDLRSRLAEMRKEGEKALGEFQKGSHGEELQKNYQDWEECPVCSGAAPMAEPE